MKTSIYKTLLTIIISASSLAGHAGNFTNNDSVQAKECLQVIGIAVDKNNDPVNGVLVKLYKENDEMEWTEITSVGYHDHNFSFTLNANEYYTIEISKPGFVTRSIWISTMLPKKISLDVLFTYEFDVTLFKEKKGADDYYFDFPVALISYDAQKGIFDNHEVYTKNIKNKIQAELNKTTVESMINGTK